MPGGGTLGSPRAGEKAGAAMKKMFSCSSNQVAVETWNKQDQKLLDAVEKGDVGKVSLLMSKKTARPTKPNALGQTAFHLAASKGLTECLTVLLNHGADANAKNDDGSTALHLATISCQPQCVKVLLQHGANEDCLDGGNWTPLHWAALSGCASSVLLLCDQEASLDVTDNNGRTPLMVAAQVKQPAVCSQLLQRGATVDLTDRDGKTALMIACESGSTESVELLLQSGADVARVDRAGRDALHYAKRAKDRALRRLVRNALRKRKKREQGHDPSSEASSQVPSESERETNGSSLTLQSERRDPSDGEEEEEEEGSELKEWRTRYREEKMKVIQLELQLAQKEKECEALSNGCKAMTERVWDQVQEISQLLPEGDDRAQGWKALSWRYSRDSTEEDYFLNLLAEQVQELKRRRQKLEMREKQVSQKLETQEEKAAAVQAETEVRWPGEEEEEEQKRQQAELKRLQAEVAAALEEKASAEKRVQEMEGHMENMRAIIGVYEAKRKNQSGALKELEARVKALGGENQRLRGLLAKRPAGKPESALAREKLCQFLTDMEKVSDEVQKENAVVMAENVALKREAEEALGSKLQRQAVPSGAVRRSVLAWKKVTEGLERALIQLGQVNGTFLEKGRALREALLAPSAGAMVNGDGPLVGEKGTLREEAKPSPGNPKIPEESRKVGMGKDHVPNGPVGQVKLRRKPEPAEEKAGPCRKSSDLEKEVWDLKKSNGTLAKELAQLSREREKLQEELQRLCSPKEETSQAEGTKNAVEELERTVDSLTQQLSAEKEEARKLHLKLEAQKEEMEAVKGGFLKEASKEANSIGVENLDSCILKELHWKLDNVVKKQNEALQLVSEMEEENHSLEAEQNGLGTFPREKKPQLDVSLEAADAAGDNVKVRQRMSELEKGLEDAKEALEVAEASPDASGRGAGKLKQLLDQLGAKMAELRHEEEEALKKHEKVRGMLSVRAQALGSELASLLEKYEEARGECVLHRDALAAEKRKNEELRGEAAEHEEEVEELRGKSQMMENAVEKLHKKVEDLTKACQDREAKIKKLLKETEKLSSEVLNLRSERARLQLHIEMVQKNHQEIVTIYRTHLLNAAQGFMDEEVHSMLLQILQTNS
ncbi:ankyrin repeat domain-containing protein 35 isoform X1 [Pogona vitticeps]